MEPLSVTASIIAVLQVTSKIISICYDYTSAVKNSSSELSRVIEEIKDLRNVLETLEQLARKAESSDPAAGVQLPALQLLSEPEGGPLAKCLAELEALKQKLTPQSLNGQAKSKRKALLEALGWPLKEKETEKILRNIERFKTTLALATTADQVTMLLAIKDLATLTQETSLDIQKGVASLQTSFLSKSTDDHVEKIHKWLAAPDPWSNYRKALEERHIGTGNWFLNSTEFTSWKTNLDSFLWLYGKPGSGKSILAGSIIENVMNHRRPGMAVAFFFFDFADSEKQHHEKMIRSLITQLSTQNSHVPHALDSLFSSCSNGNIQPSLESLLSLLREIIEQFHETFVIIDALDECKIRDKLLTVIDEIVDWKLDRLHILTTSRKEYDIQELMNELSEDQERICVQDVQVRNDIYAYVRDRIQTDRNLKRWQKDVEMQQEIEETLVKKADGMFRWVTCQLDSLKGCLNRSSLRKALKSLPKSLDDTYARILCNIDEDHRQYALKILQWLTHSVRPITLAEIGEVLAVDIQEDPRFDVDRRFSQPRDILMICSSLVTTAVENNDIDDANVEVKLAHFSVKEYLVSDRIRNGPAKDYSIQESHANASIAETCLAYFLHFVNSGLPAAQFIYAFPLAIYASKNWISHAEVADSEASTYPMLIMELLIGKKCAFLNLMRIPDFHSFGNDGYWDLCSPLYYASSKGLLEPVKSLLDKGCDVNAEGGYHGTALQAASFGGDEMMVQLLLEKGADVNAKCGMHMYRTALQVASATGHERAVPLLLGKNASVNVKGEGCDSALVKASRKGHEKVVQLLLEKGADLEAENHAFSPLISALLWRHEKVVQLLLEKGANIYVETGLYSIALKEATSTGYEKGVQLLLQQGLERGADIDFEDLLKLASFWGHERVIQLLLEKGANINARIGVDGNTALELASYRGHEKVVRLLLEKGADVNARGESDGAALEVALQVYFEQWIRFFQKVDVLSAYFPDHSSKLSSNEEIEKVLRVLLDKREETRASDGYKETIQAASDEGIENLVQSLLEKGLDTYIQGRYQVFFTRKFLSRKEVVQILFDHGADVNLLSDTALKQAALIFNFEEGSSCCMKMKLTSKLKGEEVRTTHCRGCEKDTEETE